MTFELKRSVAGALWFLLSSGAFALAEGDDPRRGATLNKRWIDDDIDTAYARAQASGKPLLVAFR